MSEVLRYILWMSASGSAVILAVLAVRAAGRKAPKLFAYALWIVVLFRLLCPIAVESEFSALGAGEQVVRRVMESVDERNEEKENALRLADDGAGASAVLAGTETAAGLLTDAAGAQTGLPQTDGAADHSRLPVDLFLFLVWIAGMAVLFGCSLLSELRLRGFLRTAVREEGNIYIKSGIQTPFVLGLFAPKIYLPEGISGREREYLLLHERTHIKRGDIVTRRLAFLALVLHWFNPLVWVAFFLSGRDMEMSCDEHVLKTLGNGIKRDYSHSLLAMADKKRLTTGIPITFAEGDTKRRIRNVLQYRRTKAGIAVLCVCVFALVLLMLGTNPKTVGGETGESGGYMAGEEAPDVGMPERNTEITEPDTGTSDEEQKTEIPEPDEEPENGRMSESRTETRIRYASALRKLLEENEFPDGMEADLIPSADGNYSIMKFSVCDVDGDGREELLLLYDPGIMAGMEACIYDGGCREGELKLQWKGFPDFCILPNGSIKELSSHNQTHGEMWPFFLWRYLPETDEYQRAACAFSMDYRILESVGFADRYPAEADTSGTGTVYYVGGQESDYWLEEHPLDITEYQTWLKENRMDEEAREVQYLPLTEENIRTLE